MSRHGVIDVGSSAIKFAVYGRTADGMELIKEGDPVSTGLGRGLRPGGPLEAGARSKSLEAIKTHRDAILALGGHPELVLATEAVRKTGDREAFLAEIRRIVGRDCEVRCIAGADEARFAFESARRALGDLGRGLLTVDPGGSSNDLAFAPEGHPALYASLPFGMNRLMELAPPERDEGRVSEPEREALRAFMRETYGAFARTLRSLARPRVLVGTSGAVIALAGMQLGLRQPERDHRVRACHGATVNRDTIAGQIAALAGLSAAERRLLHPCLGPTRAAIVVHGALAYDCLLEALGLDEVRVNAYGMKFGALAAKLAAPGS